MINICFVVCILLFAPQVYIELPLGSSKRELHFWTLEYCLLTYSGAMITNFRNLKSIVALLLAFQYLLPSYILSSLWGAPGGSSIFGHQNIVSLHILGAMIKSFKSLKSIVTLLFSFQYLLPRYILSSFQGAPGGSSISGNWDFGSLHIQEQ